MQLDEEPARRVRTVDLDPRFPPADEPMAWTWFRTGIGVGIGVLCAAVAAVMLLFRPGLGMLPVPFVTAAPVAVAVALGGRWGTVRRARWARVPLFPDRSGAAPAPRAAGVVRRFGTTVTVTPTRVVVREAFTVTEVPRHLVTGLAARHDGDLSLQVEGGRPILVPAGGGAGRYAHHRPRQVRMAYALIGLLDSVPVEGGSGQVVIRRRTGVVVLAVVGPILVCVLAAAIGGAFR
ncbi:hypothetical protein R8Z50_20835 [Longispora sp. K20-0274]|uniref:hypothetical protein n=1 Tax=Longispora sp. K20-0274 TaxID=3088255 RepID=UPI00399BA0DF